LLHAVEHWNFFASPDHTPAWLQPLDHVATAMVLFLFSGKAYGVFAMMFGISFQVILDRWSKRGINFHDRFVWRMALLALFGYLHGPIFWGDFLLVIALFGTPLLFVYGLSNRTLLVIAAPATAPASLHLAGGANDFAAWLPCPRFQFAEFGPPPLRCLRPWVISRRLQNESVDRPVDAPSVHDRKRALHPNHGTFYLRPFDRAKSDFDRCGP
jgi:uncharacterized protein